MKLACQRCGANYTVADAKIAGKRRFRCRCQRCGEDIVVQRDASGATRIEPVRDATTQSALDRVSFESPTAPRDSNSMLFSLSMLQSRSEASRSTQVAPRTAVDDIITVANMPVSPLVARPPEPAASHASTARPNHTIAIAAVAAALIIANGGIAVAMLFRPAPVRAVHASVPVTTIPARDSPAIAIASPPPAVLRHVETPGANPPSTAGSHPNHPAANHPTSHPVEARTTPLATPPAHESSCATRCHGDVACLMQCSVGPTPANNEHTAATPTASTSQTELPSAPQRDDVLHALNSVRSSVNDCARAHPGTASVTVTFAGSGHVTGASVAAPYAGTTEGSCITRAMRSASIAPFARASFVVTYPYAVR